MVRALKVSASEDSADAAAARLEEGGTALAGQRGWREDAALLAAAGRSSNSGSSSERQARLEISMRPLERAIETLVG